MAGALYLFPPRAQTDAGALLPGASLAFYTSGTLTPLEVYANGDLARPIGVSLRADSAARFADFMLYPGVDYRAILTDTDGAQIFDLDPFTAMPTALPDTPLDNAGQVMPLSVLTLWLSHTTELAPIYSDSGLTTPLDNPVTSDTSGVFPAIYLDTAVTYRARLEQAGGVLVFDVDPAAVPASTPPTDGRRIFVQFVAGHYLVFAGPDYSSPIIEGDLDPGLGVFNGVTYGDGVIACYGAFNEGAAAGVLRSIDGGVSFGPDWSAPIYSNAPLWSRMAYGPAGPIVGLDQKFFHVGTRFDKSTRCASSPDAPDSAFSWSPDSDLAFALGNNGCAGIDFPGGSAGDKFYAYGNDGTIAMFYADTSSWIPVASGGPSSVYSHNSSTGVPLAHFARSIAVDPALVIGMFAGRLVVSADGGSSWDLVSYLDAFHDANLVGGRGLNNPVRFGIAQGNGIWVAVGSVAGVPRIRYANGVTFTDIPWADADMSSIPALGAIDAVQFDEVSGSFFAIYRYGDVAEDGPRITWRLLRSFDGVTWVQTAIGQINGGDVDAADLCLFPADLS